MTEEKKIELEAHIGRAFLDELFLSTSIDFTNIQALLEGPQAFGNSIVGINPELALFPSILERSGVEELLELAKDRIPEKIAILLGAKSAEVTW